MSPMTLIPVTDANVKLEWKIILDSQERKTENLYEMLIDDYLDEVYDLLNLDY